MMTHCRINSIYSYKPVFLDATLDLLQKIADDNIQHVEMRGIHRLYDLVPPFTYNSTAIIKQWLAILHRTYSLLKNSFFKYYSQCKTTTFS
jgi:hypothetical protein